MGSQTNVTLVFASCRDLGWYSHVFSRFPHFRICNILQLACALAACRLSGSVPKRALWDIVPSPESARWIPSQRNRNGKPVNSKREEKASKLVGVSCPSMWERRSGLTLNAFRSLSRYRSWLSNQLGSSMGSRSKKQNLGKNARLADEETNAWVEEPNHGICCESKVYWFDADASQIPNGTWKKYSKILPPMEPGRNLEDTNLNHQWFPAAPPSPRQRWLDVSPPVKTRRPA